jgi:hypothetical protein
LLLLLLELLLQVLQVAAHGKLLLLLLREDLERSTAGGRAGHRNGVGQLQGHRGRVQVLLLLLEVVRRELQDLGLLAAHRG